MNSRRVKGEHAPAWLGAGLLALGLGSWTGAAASVHAEPSATEVAAPQVETSASQPRAPEQTATPEAVDDSVVVAEAGLEPQSKPERAAADEPCAPVVELRFAQGATDVADAEALRRIVGAAASYETHKIVVEGYASAAGPSHRNLQLSHRRARRAKARLVKQGIDAKRITIQAFGEYRPNLGGDENRDRRVVVKLQGMPSCPDQDGEEVAQ